MIVQGIWDYHIGDLGHWSVGILGVQDFGLQLNWRSVGNDSLCTIELWPKHFEPFLLICCAIADASRNTDAPKE